MAKNLLAVGVARRRPLDFIDRDVSMMKTAPGTWLQTAAAPHREGAMRRIALWSCGLYAAASLVIVIPLVHLALAQDYEALRPSVYALSSWHVEPPDAELRYLGIVRVHGCIRGDIQNEADAARICAPH